MVSQRKGKIDWHTDWEQNWFKMSQSREIPVLSSVGQDLCLSQIPHLIGLGHSLI